MALHLPTLAEMNAKPHATAKSAMRSQLQDDKAADRQAKKDDAIFRAAVWKRDKGLCRCCRRPVRKTIERVPERGEVHHVHGRVGKLRYLVKAALLLCATDHERVTGSVGVSKLLVIPTKQFTLDGQTYTDAGKPVTFKEAQ